MADEESKLGFDASQALSALKKLQKEFEHYSQALRDTAKATGSLNTAQEQVDEVLKRVSTFAELAAGSFKSLTKEQLAAARAAKQLNRAQGAGARKAQSGPSKAQLDNAKLARQGLEGGLFKGFRSKASLTEIVAFDKSLDAFEKTVLRTDVSATKVGSILKSLRAQWSGTAREIRDAAVSVLSSTNKLGGANVKATARTLASQTGKSTLTQNDLDVITGRAFRRDNTGAKLREIETGLRNVARGAKEATRDTKDFNLSLASIGKIAITQAALSGIFRLIGAFKDATTAAIDFEIKLAEIGTISSTFLSAGLDATGDAVATLSKQFGAPLEEVAAGLYETLSNQIGTAAESQRFLTDAMVFGQASVTGTAQAVNVLSSVINSYGLNAANAGDISGKLFRTIDLGRVTGNELSESFGRVLPLAAELGVTFDEVAAAIAHLTIQGVKANEAYTLISNVLLKLIRPTKALQGEFDRLGISSVQLGIQAFGLQGFLQKVTQEAGTSAEGIGELFNQIRGTRGVLGLTGKTADEYAKTLKQIKEASVEAAEGAAAIVQSTPAQSLQREFAAARAFLVNDFGRDAVSVLSTFVSAIGGGENAVKALGVALAGLGLAGGAAVFVAIGSSVTNLIINLKTLQVSANAAKLALLGVNVVLLPALVLGVAFAYSKLTSNVRSAAEEINNFKDAQDREAKAGRVAQRGIIRERAKALEEALPQVAGNLFKLQNLYNEDRDSAINAQTQLNASLKGQLAKRVSLLNSFVGNLQSIQSRSVQRIQDITNDSLNLKFAAGQGRFQRDIQGLDDPAKAKALVSRSLQILAAARSAADKGNEEFATTLFAEAAGTAEQAAGLRQNQVNVEGAINSVLQERLRFNDKLIDQQRDASAEAARLEHHNQAIADAVSQRVGELNQLSLLKESGTTSAGDAQKVAERQLQLAGEVDRLLGQVKGGKLSEVLDTASFKTQIREITSGAFDPASRTITSFRQAFDNVGSEIISTLTKRTKNIPLEFRISFKTLTGEEIDLLGNPEKVIQGLSKAVADFNTKNEGSLELSNLQKDQRTAIKTIDSTINNIITNLIRNAVDRAGPEFGSIKSKRDGILGEAVTKGREVQGLAAQATEGITTQNSQLILQVLNKIAELRAQAQSQTGPLLGFTREGPAADQLLVDLQTLETEINAAAENLPALEQAVLNNNAASLFADQLKGLPQVTQTAVSTVQNSFNGFSTQTAQQQIDALISKIRSIPPVPTAPVQRAMGGPIGPDTVKANLTPGEFVSNPRASRMFRSQLVAMNRGINPGFAAGGEVTNNNFGGVNVTLSREESKRLDGGAIDKAIKRAARKKLIRG